MSEQDISKAPLAASKQTDDTRQDPSELATSNNKWGAERILLTGLAVAVVISLVIYLLTGAEWNSPNIHWLPITLMLTIIFVTTLFLSKKIWFLKNISQFNSWIFGVTIIGGTIAFLLPLAIANDFGKDSEGTALRQMLIYTTGGLLGVITLSETRRKNDQEKKKNKDEKKKNKQDHIRQVHAERRSRYAKAIEQLADEKAAIRLGGIYTLVGLVDEWLADKDIEEINIRRKEGQVIINNLCSYIRAPFLFAEKLEAYEARKDLNVLEELEAVLSPEEGSPQLQALHKRVIDSSKYKEPEDIAAAYAKHREEQDVRRAIFAEMSKRIKVSQDEVSVVSSAWSDFEFDFSRALIFYPLNNLTIGKAIFSSAQFYGEADFRDTEFTKDADFKDAKFTGNANFQSAKFTGEAKFQSTEFTGNANFQSAKFTGDANFKDAKFTGEAKFQSTEFTGDASFQNAEFTGDANFWSAKFTRNANFRSAKFTRNTDFQSAKFTEYANFQSVKFTGNANFWSAKFTGNANFQSAKFTGNANFQDAEFTGNANFQSAKFTGEASFWGAKFTREASFWRVKFTEYANFWHVKFTGNANFQDAEFTEYANFLRTEFTGTTSFKHADFKQYPPIFAIVHDFALFSAQVNPQDYYFAVRQGSKPINCGTTTLLGETFEIPLGSVLFDPMSPKRQNGNYSGLSDPAKL